MKKTILIIVTVFLNLALFSCSPERMADTTKTEYQDCCGNGGDFPPPPPPPPPGNGG